jgi:hypothetical protein
MYTDAEERDMGIEAARDDVDEALRDIIGHAEEIQAEDYAVLTLDDLYIIANNVIAAARRLQTAADRLKNATEG